MPATVPGHVQRGRPFAASPSARTRGPLGQGSRVGDRTLRRLRCVFRPPHVLRGSGRGETPVGARSRGERRSRTRGGGRPGIRRRPRGPSTGRSHRRVRRPARGRRPRLRGGGRSLPLGSAGRRAGGAPGPCGPRHARTRLVGRDRGPRRPHAPLPRVSAPPRSRDGLPPHLAAARRAGGPVGSLGPGHPGDYRGRASRRHGGGLEGAPLTRRSAPVDPVRLLHRVRRDRPHLPLDLSAAPVPPHMDVRPALGAGPRRARVGDARPG